MNANTHNHPFMMSISLEAHRTAQIFRSRHTDSARGKQIYLNTLAVYAVHDYLEMLGIETNLADSSSWDPITQMLADTGALQVGTQGLLECRPVLPNADAVYVPPETWSDRLGYVAVQLDQGLETATLLGFLPNATTEEIALEQLAPLEDCLDVIEASSSVVTHLSEWLQNTVEAGWQTVEELFQLPQPAFAFRGNMSPLYKIIASDESIVRCRPLALQGNEPGGDFALVVSVKPHNKSELDIWVKVLPLGDQTHLPSDLELKLIDTGGEPVMQAQSRETESMGLKFRGGWGDYFSINITTSKTTIVEHFMI